MHRPLCILKFEMNPELFYSDILFMTEYSEMQIM